MQSEIVVGVCGQLWLERRRRRAGGVSAPCQSMYWSRAKGVGVVRRGENRARGAARHLAPDTVTRLRMHGVDQRASAGARGSQSTARRGYSARRGCSSLPRLALPLPASAPIPPAAQCSPLAALQHGGMTATTPSSAARLESLPRAPGALCLWSAGARRSRAPCLDGRAIELRAARGVLPRAPEGGLGRACARHALKSRSGRQAPLDSHCHPIYRRPAWTSTTCTPLPTRQTPPLPRRSPRHLLPRPHRRRRSRPKSRRSSAPSARGGAA